VSWPRNWVRPTDRWAKGPEIVAAATDHPIVLSGGVIDDQGGTNVMALAYPGGQRLLRCGPATDWALEEKYEGRPPRARHLSRVKQMWAVAVESVVEGRRQTVVELGPPVLTGDTPATREIARWMLMPERADTLAESHRHTNEQRAARGEEPLTSEEFREVIELVASGASVGGDN
jgi:hypothetical protein